MDTRVKTPFVLIVEDDRDIAAHIRNVLDLAGFRTEVAVTGRLAVNLLNQMPPDIVLLDVGVKDVSSREILQTLFSVERFRQIRTVVIGGYPHVSGSQASEPNLVLEKPVDLDNVAGLVQRLCQDNPLLQVWPFDEDHQDQATGLYNRAFFTYRLGMALQNFLGNPENKFGVLVLRPLSVKNLTANPEIEHDYIPLNEIARAIDNSVRATDTVARFEPSDFYILVETLQSTSIMAEIAGRIGLSLGQALGSEIQFSLGALLVDDRFQDVEGILSAAELQGGRD
jgi:PleD family two-component response regulator